jgi:hypothetical protein
MIPPTIVATDGFIPPDVGDKFENPKKGIMSVLDQRTSK